jgi:ribosome recycling factor
MDSLDDVLLDCEDRMDKAVKVFRDELRGLRTGRATPALVEHIKVNYYGNPTPLRSLASISCPEPMMILIRPFDPAALKEIERAIQTSDLGLSPNNDGKVIRLVLPPLSVERRKQLVYRVRELAEQARIAIRNVRRDANKDIDRLEKEGLISEDNRNRAREEIQELTKKHEEMVNELAEQKCKEIMEE